MRRFVPAGFLAMVVTAAVTFGALAQNAPWQVVLTNMATGHFAIYNRSFPSQEACVKALGNLPEVLVSVADENAKTIEPEGDEALIENVARIVYNMLMNTGALPKLSITCKVPGTPA